MVYRELVPQHRVRSENFLSQKRTFDAGKKQVTAVS